MSSPGPERWVTDANVALLTDLYELTMAQGYFEQRMNHPATFDLFVRKLPERRNFLVAAGLDDALDYLEKLRFDPDAIAYLRSLGTFKATFLDFLATLRFTGEVWAFPEGEAVFANEPILRVTAPLIEAQIVETFLLNATNFQTLIASKAARIAIACGGRQFVDFSPRRDHGADAAMKAARASYIGGAVATSNVLAGKVYGLELSGTMAHAFVMSFDRELDAFLAFARAFPDRTTLLIDTYDTLEGARNALRAAEALAPEGVRINAVRLDSGDLVQLSKGVRRILDEGGQPGIRIFASGDLDEYRIAEALAAGAPVDAFGVGTQLGTSADAPALGGVYKLVEDVHGPRVKLSTGKETLPSRKQVYRFTGPDGRITHDVIALEDESQPSGGRPILQRVMANGRRLSQSEPLDIARERCRATLTALPAPLLSLTPSAAYDVRLSSALQATLAQAQARAGIVNRES